jgi:hypothetical protein
MDSDENKKVFVNLNYLCQGTNTCLILTKNAVYASNSYLEGTPGIRAILVALAFILDSCVIGFDASDAFRVIAFEAGKNFVIYLLLHVHS